MKSAVVPAPDLPGAAPEYTVEILRGGNRYSTFSVLVGTLAGTLDPGPDAYRSTDELDAILHGLGLPGAPLDRASAPARLIEAICLRIRGHLDLLPIEPDAADSEVRFVCSADPPSLAPGIAALAADIVLSSEVTGGQDFTARLRELRASADRLRPDIQIKALERECWRRDIPFKGLSWTGQYDQIGTGSRQCRLDLTITSRTGRLAVAIAGDKLATNQLFRAHGIPVPRQAAVEDVAQAWAAAMQIGLPVVVKPRFGRKGRNVSVKLKNRREVDAAAYAVLKVDKTALVESYVEGADHRVLVAYGEILGVGKRIPAHVVGDGVSKVKALIEQENGSPRRSDTQLTLLSTIVIDTETTRRLAAAGYNLESVPKQGEVVFLKYGGNRSTGATVVDATAELHPDNARMLLEAVELIGLDVAGIDFLTTDVSRPYGEVKAAICEINARPGLRGHMIAELGSGGSVVGRFIELVAAANNVGRVPTVAICDRQDATLSERLADMLWREHRVNAGILRADCALVRGAKLPVKFDGLEAGFGLLAENPTLQVIIAEIDPARALSEGLGLTHVDLAVATGDVDEDLRAILTRCGARWLEESDLLDVLEAIRLLVQQSAGVTSPYASY